MKEPKYRLFQILGMLFLFSGILHAQSGTEVIFTNDKVLEIYRNHLRELGWPTTGKMIEQDSLEFREEECYYHGVPFSGFLVQRDKANGFLQKINQFKDGAFHGLSIDVHFPHAETYFLREFDGEAYFQRQYNHAGRLLHEMNMKGGKRHGFQGEWTDTGQPVFEENYQNGQKHGAFKTWYPDGSLRTRYYFENDCPMGQSDTYYSNGVHKDRTLFERCMAEGPFESWYENGLIRATGSFHLGEKNGTWTWRDSAQQVLVSVTFRENMIAAIHPGNAFADTVLVPEIQRQALQFLENQKKSPFNGYLIHHHPNGVISKWIPCRNGHPVENFAQNFTADGTPKEGSEWVEQADGVNILADYQNGFLTRLCHRNDADSSLRITWFYPDFETRDTLFDGMHRILSTGSYHLGNKNGEWVSWDRELHQRTVSEYKDGRLHGWELVYDVAGKLIRETYYEHGIRKLKSPSEPLKTEGIVPVEDLEFRNGKWFYQDKPYSGEIRYTNADKLTVTAVRGRQTGAVHGVNEFSNVRIEGFMINGAYDGTYREFWPGGELKTAGEFNVGEKTGTWQYAYRDGSWKGEGIYKNGNIEEGWEVEWDVRGKVVRREFFKEGCPFITVQIIENVSGRTEAPRLADGTHHGVSFHWFPSGHLHQRSFWHFGSQIGDLQEWYENGQLRSSISYRNGYMHGFQRQWTITGQLTFEREFSEGNLVGFHREWDEQGNLLKEGEYKNGKPVGPHPEWNSEGVMFRFTEFDEDGLRHGKYWEKNEEGVKIYFGEFEHGTGTIVHKIPEGIKVAEDHYVRGRHQGFSRQWNRSGELVLETLIENGREIWRNKPAEFAKNEIDFNNLQRKGSIHIGPRGGFYSGRATKKSPEGELLGEWWFHFGRMDSACRQWYPGGQLSWEQHNLYGRPHGLQRHWHENGQLHYRWNCKDGKRQGLSEVWNESGQLITSEELKNDMRHGKYAEYFPDGKWKTKGQYWKNILVGEWQYQSESGEISRKFYPDSTFYTEARPRGPEELHLNPDDSLWYLDDRAQLLYSGAFQEKYPNGQVRESGELEDGRKEGEWKMWYENGQRWKNEMFFMDIPYDTFTYFNRQGEVIAAGFRSSSGVVNGDWGKWDGDQWILQAKMNLSRKHGTWTTKVDDILYRQSWFHGLEHGEFAQQNESGKMIFRGQYKYGRKHGKWEYFDENGKLEKTENYSCGIAIE